MSDPHDGVLAVLQAAVPRLGDAEAPADTSFPYGVCYPISEPPPAGPVGAPSSDRALIVQVTAAGLGRQDCLWYLDRCRAAILALRHIDSATDVLQATVVTRRFVKRDDDLNPPVFTWVEQWQLLTTPA